jgi:hypothetical protein
MYEHAQRPCGTELQQWLEHWPGEPEDDQQRADVADDDVLDHVRDQHLVGERVQWGQLHGRERRRAGGKADPAPPRNRTSLSGEHLALGSVEQQVGGRGEQWGNELACVQPGEPGRDGEDGGCGGHGQPPSA